MANDERPGLLSRVFGGGRRQDPPPRIEPAAPRAPAQALRPQTHEVRRFKAARPSRLIGGFGGLLQDSPRSEVRQDLRGLINHARMAAQNIDHLRSYEMMVRRHVVGPGGIALQMNARNPDGTPDTWANDRIASAWRTWGKRGNCTPCGRLSWWQVEKIAATMLAREGNFLLRAWAGPRFGPHAFQVQPLSVDLLDLDLVQTLGGGAYIDGGVEFDQFNRPTAFYFFDGHPAESHTGRTRQRIRVPADQVVHVIRHTETGQGLGVPESHTALRRLNLLSQYEESAMQAAHYGAAAMVFLEQTDPEGSPAPAPGAGGVDEIPEELEAGMIATLPPGYTVKGNPSNYPDANMPGFLKSLQRGAAAGLGVSYAGMSADMEGANYSSLKDGRGEERDEWRVFQRDLYEGLHGEVFKLWLPQAILSGAVPLPMSKLDKWLSATWRPRGWLSPNPKDDAAAADMNLKNRLAAPSDLVAERGEDFEALTARLAQDLKILEAAGVPVPQALVPAWSPTTLSPPTDPAADPGAGGDGSPTAPAE